MRMKVVDGEENVLIDQERSLIFEILLQSEEMLLHDRGSRVYPLISTCPLECRGRWQRVLKIQLSRTPELFLIF